MLFFYFLIFFFLFFFYYLFVFFSFFFFFSSRRRHTRSLRDWSADVCSSDLGSELLCVFIAFIRSTGGPLGDQDGSRRQDCPCRLYGHRHRHRENGCARRRSEERRVGKECRCGGWPYH